ncbi:thioredoxin-like protein [Obba rivulosa]|uniref:Thioredoxin-like protein n=1 Tax=Obba rivulosa TaxID=1052685 RepID=A0A8E2J2C4_9APHY|nr:thioredoxin-like protein [Obba rivulosa]
MNGDIEELVLSGKLFNPPSRSSSPVRSRSPSPSPAQWPEDGADYDYDSDAERRRVIEERVTASQKQESIGLGVPGRTGVKGVLRDHAEATGIARAKRAEDIKILNRAMEKASLGGKTWAEEERERLAEKARLEGKASSMMEERGEGRGRFGHLREVGIRSFVQAVEEESDVWVVVHIYDPSLDRCAILDETLSRLARQYTSTKFLRARAGAIGFATSGSSASNFLSVGGRRPFPIHRSRSRQILVPGRYPGEEDDPYGDNDNDDDEDSDSDSDSQKEAGWDDDNVDTDVLPTLLVYRAGQLVHSWIRVDWEAKEGVEELLKRHHILSDSDFRGGTATGVQGWALDDDDLDDDFDDGELVFGGSDDEL